MRKLMLAAACIALLLPAAAAADRPGGGCIVDVSGLWQGVFQGQVFSGEVTLMITQDHRRFHWTAFASAVQWKRRPSCVIISVTSPLRI